ncbi:MAG: hypothetical protein K6G15_05040 [Desulfovibrio sp.]|nr:hypothetical protein [Desulfovibrio sp.]
MQQTNLITVPNVKGSDLLLHNLGLKLAHGMDLNSPERVMAISTAAYTEAGKYGPTVETFEVKPMDLPESTKGVLADYAG